MECVLCGGIADVQSFVIDGENVCLCENCRNEHLKQCYDCEEYFIDTQNDYVVDCNGDVYCESCRENLSYCEHCNQYSDANNFIHITDIDEWWCDECANEAAYVCHECNEYISENYGDCNISLCQSCLHENYFFCEDCNELYHIDDAFSTDNGMYCEYCYNENYSNNINNYSYQPDLNFQSSIDDNEKILPYLGFELESGGADTQNSINEIAELISEDNEDILYLKEDGSIPDYGFEMVSHPITLKRHKELDWENILNTMSNNGLRSHDLENCGLHVHVSRNYLTPYKWLLVDWLISKHQDEFELLARRKETHWAAFKKNSGEGVKETYGKSTCRYQAVNFCNSQTVEFRLFRGTLKYSTFMATLELVDALVHWAKQVSICDILHNKNALIDFVKYAKEHNNLYSNLINYMEKKICV